MGPEGRRLAEPKIAVRFLTALSTLPLRSHCSFGVPAGTSWARGQGAKGGKRKSDKDVNSYGERQTGRETDTKTKWRENQRNQREGEKRQVEDRGEAGERRRELRRKVGAMDWSSSRSSLTYSSSLG